MDNADTWFTSLDLLLRALVTRYKIPHIFSIYEFLISVGEWLARTKKVEALENDFRTARDGAVETTTRLDEATEKVQVLEAAGLKVGDLENQKERMSPVC